MVPPGGEREGRGKVRKKEGKCPGMPYIDSPKVSTDYIADKRITELGHLETVVGNPENECV